MKITNEEAFLHLWESVDRNNIYQMSYIRNLALELGEKDLYFKFRDAPKKEEIKTIPNRD